MASSEEQNRALLEKTMKELEIIVKQNVNANNEQQPVSHGIINNSTLVHKLELKYIHEYSGHFVTPGPSQELNYTSEKDHITIFSHQGMPPKGSKVGVAYFANGHQWIMAWSFPIQSGVPDHKLNKVYAEDGPDAPIDWDEIEKKLDLSEGDVSSSPNTMVATSTGNGGEAFVGALFVNPGH